MIPSPATTLVVERAKTEKQVARKAWLRSIPDGYVTEFVERGLLPLLKARGFAIGFTVADCVSCIKDWGFGHVWKSQHPTQKLVVKFVKTANQGTHEEYDLYKMKLDFFDLLELAEDWKREQFLDDTRAGESQLYDLDRLIWNMISVQKSKTFRAWHALMSEEDYEEMNTAPSHQEDTGYGGDRRTY